MSQSDLHRNLVLQTAKKLMELDSHMLVTTDVQTFPGDEVPPLINGFRPDVYARRNPSSQIVIAEAKTGRDIDNRHTREQVVSFINHLEEKENSLFILTVQGQEADHAKTFLRFMCREIQVSKTRVAVFDSFDLWFLDLRRGLAWHLY